MIYRKWLALLCFCLSAVAVSAQAADNPWKIKLPFKTAIIHYDVKGSTKGTETLYIRQHGQEMVKITKAKGKVFFVPIMDDKVEITSPDWIITVDRNKKEGTKITNPSKFLLEEYKKLSSKEKATVRKNIKELGVNMTRQLGGSVKLRAGKHLGYTCDVVKMMGITVYQMTGTAIALKSTGSMLGVKVNTVATKLEKNVQIPNAVFQPPEGINIIYQKKVDDMNQQMAIKMINYLKDPEASKKQGPTATDTKQVTSESGRQPSQNANSGSAGVDESDEEKKGVKNMMKKGIGVFKGLLGGSE